MIPVHLRNHVTSIYSGADPLLLLQLLFAINLRAISFTSILLIEIHHVHSGPTDELMHICACHRSVLGVV